MDGLTQAPARRAAARHSIALGAALVSVTLIVTACGHQTGPAASSGSLPVLHLASSMGMDAPAMATGGAAARGGPMVPGPIGWGGYVLAGSLPTGPDRAAVRRWTTSAASSAEVTRLARALGITGAPRRHAHGWVVTGRAGTLRVADSGGHQWAFVRADQGDCPPVSVDVDGTANGATVGCAVAVPPMTTPGTSPASPPKSSGPDAAQVRAWAAPVLAALDVTSADSDAAQVAVGDPYSSLTVSPTVDGMPTQGLETSLQADPKGVTSASGRLTLPSVGRTYPLRTAKAAFEELKAQPRPEYAMYCGVAPTSVDPKPSAQSQGSPSAAGAGTATGASTGTGTATVNTTAPAPVPPTKPGTVPVPQPCPTPVPTRITGARLGLLVTWESLPSASGAEGEIVVPAWFFSISWTTDWAAGPTVIAIAPSLLAGPVTQPGTGVLPGVIGGGTGSSSSGSSGSGSSGSGSGSSVPGGAPLPPDTPATP